MIRIRDEIDSLFRKLKPIYGAKIEQLYRAYQVEDADGRKEIETRLRQLALQSLKTGVADDRIHLVPPDKDTLKGEYPIGKAIYNDEERGTFGLREGEWTQHLALFGRSGAGKTNAAYFLIGTLLSKGKPFLILDWKKNFRNLQRIKDKKDILVFTVGKDLAPFRFNPLIPPPGCEPSSYLKKLIDVIGESTYVGEGVQYLIQGAMDQLYRKHGVYERTATTYPTLHDVSETLMSDPGSGRARDWMASTRRALGALCFGEMGKVLDTQSNDHLIDLLDKHVVLELDSLTSMDKTFLIQTLLLWCHHYYMHQPRNKFRLAIIIEEAHHILRKQVGASKESIAELLLREVREFGVSITLIDQSPSLISPVALANTYTTLTMSLKSDSDVRTAANYLLLDLEDRKMLGQLPTGQAIVKLQGRWFQPFLIQIPYAPLKDVHISDEEVRRHMRTYFTDSAPKTAPNPQSKPVEEIPLKQKGEQKKAQSSQPVDQSIEETENMEGFLKNIFDEPYSSISERYKCLRLSRRKGNELKESAAQKGWVESLQVPTRNGRLVLLRLTRGGMDQLSPRPGDASLNRYRAVARCLIHEYWKQRLAKHFTSQGYEVQVEKKINGEAVDLVLQKDGEKTAVEIETGNSNYRKNIEKALQAGFEKVLCLATSKPVENRIAETLQNFKRADRDKVRIACLTDESFS